MEKDIEITFPITESIEDVTTSSKAYARNFHREHPGFLIFCIALIVVGILSFIIFNSGLCIFISLLGLALIISFNKAVKFKMQSTFMKQFADANKFTFAPVGEITQEIGSIFKRGNYKIAQNIVTGSFQGYPLRLFNYSYTIGEGKNRQVYNYTIFDLDFKADLPQMFLDAKADNGFTPNLANLEKINLESQEFSKHFNLYIAPNSQIEALQVFTPDLMAELIDLPKSDMELIGHQIYIYHGHIIRTNKDLQDLFKLAQHLITNVAKEIERMHKIAMIK